MEKYFKMSSHFVGNVSINADGQICDDKYFRGSIDMAEDYYEPICHAINSHDELVAMNKELLAALESIENDDGKIPDFMWNMIKSAIAKAKGTA